MGVKPILPFDYSNIRNISYRLAEKNSNTLYIEHTKGDSIFSGYKSECIFARTITGNSKDVNLLLVDTLSEVILKELAKITVDSWIESNNYN